MSFPCTLCWSPYCWWHSMQPCFEQCTLQVASSRAHKNGATRLRLDSSRPFFVLMRSWLAICLWINADTFAERARLFAICTPNILSTVFFSTRRRGYNFISMFVFSARLLIEGGYILFEGGVWSKKYGLKICVQILSLAHHLPAPLRGILYLWFCTRHWLWFLVTSSL